MLRRDGMEDLVRRVEGDGNHRVLRRLAVREGETGAGDEGCGSSVGVVVDVETTGMDPDEDQIVELAMRRFRYDAGGAIVEVGRLWSWREDPGRPLPAEIVRLTGLTDGDLAGRCIDEPAAVRVLTSADLVVAHNASFDRGFLERRLPDAAGLPWACSCREIDWPAAGFDGRGLGWLAAQAGWFYDAHRAAADVDAVIALLRHPMPDGRTALAELMESARTPSFRVQAVGADFAAKDALRRRGYRWDAAGRVWWREVRETELVDEEVWLAREVYAPERRPRGCGPHVARVTARERHR